MAGTKQTRQFARWRFPAGRAPAAAILFLLRMLLLAGPPSPAVAADAPLRPPVDAPASAVRGLVALRISQDLLQEAISGDIHRKSAVDRVVMGTRSIGTATTAAEVQVDLEHRQEGIAFALNLSGHTVSRTVGRQQPAIIHSCSQTRFTARKPILFDGNRFHSQPVTVQSQTQLALLGIDSVLPGLRGRFVRRVGWNRGQQSLPAAERIVAQLASRQIQQSLDAEIDQRIERLNRRLQIQGLLLRLATGLGRPQLTFSSTDRYLTVAFQPQPADASAPRCPLEKLAPAPAELWIRVNLAGPDEGLLLPSFAGDAQAWLAAVLPDVIPLASIEPPEAMPLPPLSVLLVEDWIVMQIGQRAGSS